MEVGRSASKSAAMIEEALAFGRKNVNDKILGTREREKERMEVSETVLKKRRILVRCAG